MNKPTLQTKGNFTKIFVNEVLHVAFKQSELSCIVSWIENLNWYKIELHLIHNKILLEYDDREKWMKILELLNVSTI